MLYTPLRQGCSFLGGKWELATLTLRQSIKNIVNLNGPDGEIFECDSSLTRWGKKRPRQLGKLYNNQILKLTLDSEQTSDLHS